MRNVVDDEGFEGDFYEDDEPLDKVEADFAAGHHVITGRPDDGYTSVPLMPGLISQGQSSGVPVRMLRQTAAPAQPIRMPIYANR